MEESPDVLSVVRQAKERRVEQLGLASVVPTSNVRNNVRNLGSTRCREIEFTLSPSCYEGVEVVEVPPSAVPGVGQEEFRVHFVGLQVSDVDDPDPIGMSLQSLRKVIESLVRIQGTVKDELNAHHTFVI